MHCRAVVVDHGTGVKVVGVLESRTALSARLCAGTKAMLKTPLKTHQFITHSC